MKYGILYISIIMIVGTIILEVFASPLIGIFHLSEETTRLCILATRIITAGFLLAGGNIAIQGVFQAMESGLGSLIISVLRLLIIVLPLAYLFSKMKDASSLIWYAFPIAEAVSLVVAVILLVRIMRELINKK